MNLPGEDPRVACRHHRVETDSIGRNIGRRNADPAKGLAVCPGFSDRINLFADADGDVLASFVVHHERACALGKKCVLGFTHILFLYAERGTEKFQLERAPFGLVHPGMNLRLPRRALVYFLADDRKEDDLFVLLEIGSVSADCYEQIEEGKTWATNDTNITNWVRNCSA